METQKGIFYYKIICPETGLFHHVTQIVKTMVITLNKKVL